MQYVSVERGALFFEKKFEQEDNNFMLCKSI